MAKETFAARWGKAGVEVAGIVFAVLLALWLEGWREDIERQERADAYLERITIEVTENRVELIDAIAGNKERMVGLKSALDDEDLSLRRLAPFLEVSAGSTINAAWQAAQVTMATSTMPVDTVSRLAAIYETQDYFTSYVRFFFQRFGDLVVEAQNEETSRVAVQKLYFHFQIANSLAEQVVRQYNHFLGLPPETEALETDAPVTDAPENDTEASTTATPTTPTQ